MAAATLRYAALVDVPLVLREHARATNPGFEVQVVALGALSAAAFDVEVDADFDPAGEAGVLSNGC